ncbi:hypothetical protein [Alkalibacillus haloalkaliphilus]|uniref:hypothetical protein n=1 Tax=Alkalibacillus haloalkaliphilus TaxID=94136 RepID=UPI002935FB03|nr:hypothetical protein [Alkalibacillus haloalkaliphilus]MDV2582781.1 hypothetical protein [Alkalibacillus haloalkaliphilus]
MSLTVRAVLEFLRLAVIFFFIGGVLSYMFINIYSAVGIESSTLVGVGVMLVVFVLYRNRLQFSGWYNGKQRKRLSTSTTRWLVAGSIVLILSPVIREMVTLIV